LKFAEDFVPHDVDRKQGFSAEAQRFEAVISPATTAFPPMNGFLQKIPQLPTWGTTEAEKEGRNVEQKREGIRTPPGSVGLLEKVRINIVGRIPREGEGDESVELSRPVVCGMSLPWRPRFIIRLPCARGI